MRVPGARRRQQHVETHRIILNDALQVHGVVAICVRQWSNWALRSSILTAVTHLTLKRPKRPFFPDILWLTTKHGFFAFGVPVAGAVLWQRAVGTVVVSVPVAALVLGLIAGVRGGRGDLHDDPREPGALTMTGMS
jgi:hypothetical protein